MVLCQLEILNESPETWEVEWTKASGYDCHHEDEGHDGATTSAKVKSSAQPKLFMVPAKVVFIEKGVGGTWTFKSNGKSFQVTITIPVSGDDHYEVSNNTSGVGCTLKWMGKGGWKNAHRYELVVDNNIQQTETGRQVREDTSLKNFQRVANVVPVPGFGFVANGAVALGHAAAGEKNKARAAALKAPIGLIPQVGMAVEAVAAVKRHNSKGYLACYDNQDKLTPLWEAGAEWVSDSVKCESMNTIFRAVRDFAQSHGKIKCFQIWCHGFPGGFVINGEQIEMREFVKRAKENSWDDCFEDDAIVWFRTCSTFRGKDGLAFAKHLGDAFPNLVFLGHTFAIQEFHSGLRGYCASKPFEPWSEEEGGDRSSWSAPNTLLCTDLTPSAKQLEKALLNG